MLREKESTTTQAIYATLLIQGKLASELVDSGSSMSLVCWNFLQSIGFSGALEINEGKIFIENSRSLPVEGTAELKDKLVNFASEVRAAFLISTANTFHCLLGLELLTETEWIMCANKKTHL